MRKILNTIIHGDCIEELKKIYNESERLFKNISDLSDEVKGVKRDEIHPCNTGQSELRKREGFAALNVVLYQDSG